MELSYGRSNEDVYIRYEQASDLGDGKRSNAEYKRVRRIGESVELQGQNADVDAGEDARKLWKRQLSVRYGRGAAGKDRERSNAHLLYGRNEDPRGKGRGQGIRILLRRARDNRVQIRRKRVLLQEEPAGRYRPNLRREQEPCGGIQIRRMGGITVYIPGQGLTSQKIRRIIIA